MPEKKWTEEPWKSHGDEVVDSSDCTIADCFQLPEGNADRIVACVNAVASVPDPDDFVEAVKELREAAEILITNATIGPDSRMKGLTDCYEVPLDDIETLRDALAKLPKEPEKP